MEYTILCFSCKYYTAKKNVPKINGMVVGMCSQVENIGEFNNAIYYGNPFVPCSGYKYEKVAVGSRGQ